MVMVRPRELRPLSSPWLDTGGQLKGCPGLMSPCHKEHRYSQHPMLYLIAPWKQSVWFMRDQTGPGVQWTYFLHLKQGSKGFSGIGWSGSPGSCYGQLKGLHEPQVFMFFISFMVHLKGLVKTSACAVRHPFSRCLSLALLPGNSGRRSRT